MITRIRAFLTRSSVPHGPCDPAEVIRGVLPFVHPELRRHGIILKLSLAADLPPVTANPSHGATFHFALPAMRFSYS